MANWFKVYETDLDDSKFQLLVDENPTVISVWFWILTECAKFKDGVIDFKFEPRYFRMIGKKINQDSACISEALNALHKDGFIILGENSIELMGWESRQSEFMRKQKGKEIKKVKESLNLSPDKHPTMSEVRPDIVPIRGEEIREDNIREENIREENTREKKINKKEKEIFLPPTQPEVIEYLLSKSEEYANLANYSICEQIAKKYITHFEAESWVKVNNKPIRSWKLDLNKRLEGDWLAPHLFKPKTESKAVAQWAQMVNNAQDRVVRDIMNEMRQKGKV